MARLGSATIEVNLDFGPAIKQLEELRRVMEEAETRVRDFIAAQGDVEGDPEFEEG